VQRNGIDNLNQFDLPIDGPADYEDARIRLKQNKPVQNELGRDGAVKADALIADGPIDKMKRGVGCGEVGEVGPVDRVNRQVGRRLDAITEVGGQSQSQAEGFVAVDKRTAKAG
jgi:hypothetical protein